MNRRSKRRRRCCARRASRPVAVALIHSYADSRQREASGRADSAGVATGRLRHLLDRYPSGNPRVRAHQHRCSECVRRAHREALYRRARTRCAAVGVTGSLQIMTSNGGVMTVESATRRPAYITESGPAAGVIACARMARALGLDNVISFDMGGTTAKAAMIEGRRACEDHRVRSGLGHQPVEQAREGWRLPDQAAVHRCFGDRRGRRLDCHSGP